MTSLPRIVIVGASPLLADGVAAALRDGGAWSIAIGGVDDDADAWVLLDDGVTVRGAGGASAQLSTGVAAPRLRAAVAAVLAGLSVRETPWPIDVTDREPLTPREIEVFELLGKGLSNRDIAGVLGISAHTAKYHVAQILAKVGAATRAEAVREGLRHGWIGL
ncbi:MAG TPA: helix-turn-helix transcriptional regulator [Burkholderiaceae bacterium]|nr:helix-turn-helix transcriptional regulator [Burkholderiaceae bacterium]